MRRLSKIWFVALAAVIAPVVVLGQGGPGFGGPPGMGPGFGPGGPMGFGGANATSASLQDQLHATKEEWEVIGPKIDALIAAKEATSPDVNDQGEGFGFGGRGLPQSSDTFAGPNEVPAGGNLQGGRGGFGPVGTVIGNIFSGGPAEVKSEAKPAATEPTATDPSDPASSANSGTNWQSITLVQALSDLQTAVKDKHTSDKQLGELLGVVRAARQKADADFQAAENDLRQVITPEQEAVLVSMGYMD